MQVAGPAACFSQSFLNKGLYRVSPRMGFDPSLTHHLALFVREGIPMLVHVPHPFTHQRHLRFIVIQMLQGMGFLR